MKTYPIIDPTQMVSNTLTVKYDPSGTMRLPGAKNFVILPIESGIPSDAFR